MVHVIGIVLTIIAVWIYGEYSNNRPLRLAAILIPTVIVGPLAYQFGLFSGHLRAYGKCRTQTCAFLDSTIMALDKGETSSVLMQLKNLRMGNDDIDQHAGSFFFSEMESARRAISTPLPDNSPASTVQDTPK